MGNALGFHGLALGLVIGNSMGLLYGYAMVMPTCDSHGLPWLMLHRSTMDGPCVSYIGMPPPMWLLWDWMGSDHWEFHGLVLWAMHWDSMDLRLGLLVANSMGVLHG